MQPSPQPAEPITPLERLPKHGLGGRRKRRPERHDEILRVAVEAFNARGYAITTIEEIAAGVGVSSAAVYRHFQTKQAILDTAALWIDGQLMTTLLDRLTRARTPSARLKGIVEDLVDAALNHPDFVGLMVRELHSLGPEARSVCLNHRRDYEERWCEVLLEVIPNIRRDEARLRVNGVIALVCSVTAHRAPHPAGERRLLVEMSLAALRAGSRNRGGG